MALNRSRARGLLLVSALALMSLTVCCALTMIRAQSTQAAPIVAGAIYIDDPLQESLNSALWDVSGRSGTLAPHLVAATGGGDGKMGNWLQLTSDDSHSGSGEAGFALNKEPFPSNKGVVIEYDQRIYRTNEGNGNVGGGDGLSVFLVDAAKATTDPGGFGGGLGYSSVAPAGGSSWCTNQQGVAGGYLGIGFDTYGNFAKAETVAGGSNGAVRPNVISGGGIINGGDPKYQLIGIRGSGERHYIDGDGNGGCTQPGNDQDLAYWYGMNTHFPPGHPSASHGGYRWITGYLQPDESNIAGAWLDNSFGNTAEYRKIRITLTPTSGGGNHVKVEMTDKLSTNDDICAKYSGATCVVWTAPPGYTFTQYLDTDVDGTVNPYQVTRPTNFRIGFAASTGWAVNNHQIRNLSVTSYVDLAVTKTIASGSSATRVVGQQVTYQLKAKNQGLGDMAADYPATLVDGLTGLPLQNITWTATASNGGQIWNASTGTWVTSLSGTGPLSAGVLKWYGTSNTVSGQYQVTVDITGTVTPAGTSGQSYVNTAQVVANPDGGPPDNTPANNTASATLTVNNPAWSLNKSATPASGSHVVPGQVITYKVRATNLSAYAVYDASLRDDLTQALVNADWVSGSVSLDNNGTVTNLPSLAPVLNGANWYLTTGLFTVAAGSGNYVELTYQLRVKSDPSDYGTVANYVQSLALAPPNACALDACLQTKHEIPQISIVKTGPAIVSGDIDNLVITDPGENANVPGDPGNPVVNPYAQITWLYTVQNIGSVALTNVVVSDDQGISVTCPTGFSQNLPVGQTMHCLATGQVVDNTP